MSIGLILQFEERTFFSGQHRLVLTHSIQAWIEYLELEWKPNRF